MVFFDNSFVEVCELGDVLVYVGFFIISVFDVVIVKFWEVCLYVRYLIFFMLCRFIVGIRCILDGLVVNVLVLKYCLIDVEEKDVGEKL